jgi:ubiquinone/menaquinone biosynthesis C-methylase UbiE
MKLNAAERLLVNNPARAWVQRHYEVPLLRRLGGPVEGCRVLDVGCGRGVGVELIFRQLHAASVCAVDLDPRQIQRARKRLEASYGDRVDLREGSVDQLPFADATFDAVFDFGMLHHVPDWQAGIGEIRRVLKPGGNFFFEEVTRAALRRWLYRTFLEHPVENRFSQPEFLAELANHGLTLANETKTILFGGYLHRCCKAVRLNFCLQPRRSHRSSAL